MSARDLRLEITPQANRDLSQVLTLTNRRWGRAQRVRYRTRLVSAINDLTSFPELGRPYLAAFSGLRVHQAGEHTIYYRHDDETVTVIRILHRRMNPADHLPTVESSEEAP